MTDDLDWYDPEDFERPCRVCGVTIYWAGATCCDAATDEPHDCRRSLQAIIAKVSRRHP